MVSYDGSIKIITNYFIKSITPETRSCTKRPPPPPPSRPDYLRAFAQAVSSVCSLFPYPSFLHVPLRVPSPAGALPELPSVPSPAHYLSKPCAYSVPGTCPPTDCAAGGRRDHRRSARGAPPQHRPRGTRRGPRTDCLPPARAPHFRISRRPPPPRRRPAHRGRARGEGAPSSLLRPHARARETT